MLYKCNEVDITCFATFMDETFAAVVTDAKLCRKNIS